MSSEISQETCWKCHTPKEPSWIHCPSCAVRLVDQRAPSPPSKERDLAFLYDLYSFAWYNHHAGAMALYDSTATINHFYPQAEHAHNEIPERYVLITEPGRSKKMLRAKIFAELISLFEAFGVLCLTISKRHKQSFMWTYLNADPQDVTQFYDRVLGKPSPSLQKLLKFPQLSTVQKAIDKHVNIHIPCLPEALPSLDSEHFLQDYENLMRDIISIGRMYRDNNSGNVVIYNKIKHIFPIVEGEYWLDRPLSNTKYAGIAIDDKGTIAPLPMDESHVDTEISHIYATTCIGAELMALCLGLARLNLF